MAKVVVMKNGKKIKNPFSFLKPDDIIDLSISEHITINLGNYESAKITVGLTVPVEVSNLNKAKEEVFNFIDETLNTKVEEIESE